MRRSCFTPSGVPSSTLAARRVVCGARREDETTSLNERRALVLDATFRPLGVVSWHRAITLDVLKSVEVLEYYDCFVRTVRQDYPVPAVLRSEFVMKGFRGRRMSLSRRNVLKRDGHACVYCGARTNLTVDHIVPLSRGGANTWENLVAACRSCNGKKGDRTLDQMGWKLQKAPKKPAIYDVHFRVDLPLHHPKEWCHYIGRKDAPTLSF